MPEPLSFIVKGSDPEPYRVTFERADNSVIGTCTCRAGSLGQLCKHRLNLLHGDVTAVLDGPLDQVGTLKAWAAETNLGGHLAALTEAERTAEAAKREVTNRKRALGRILAGG